MVSVAKYIHTHTSSLFICVCVICVQDKLIDHLEESLDDGNCIVDYHAAELFPERWFDKVVILRTETEVLYDRLKDR